VDEREDFIANMKRRHTEAARALLNGEPELYLAMWPTSQGSNTSRRLPAELHLARELFG
jgi:hypothetical protein